MGKGSAPTPPPVEVPEPPQIDMSAMMAAMASMFNSIQPPAPPELPPLPQIYREPEIDWTEKNAQLAAKVKADYTSEQAKKKNRTGTILSSPLLDDEDVAVSESLLSIPDNAS